MLFGFFHFQQQKKRAKRRARFPANQEKRNFQIPIEVMLYKNTKPKKTEKKRCLKSEG